MTAIDELASTVESLTTTAVRLPDEAMGRPWAWKDYDEEGLRFALLLSYHRLRELAFTFAAARHDRSLAHWILGGYVEAHTSLTGLLLSCRDDELDRSPGSDDWSPRQVLAHVLVSENGFRAACRLALERSGRGMASEPLTDDDWRSFDKAPTLDGGVSAVIRVLRSSRDSALAAFSAVPDEQIHLPVHFWEDRPYSLGFRLLRFEAHLVQHVVQAEATMVAIGHPPSEAEKLVRRVLAAFGGVEAVLIGAPAGFGEKEITETAEALREFAAALAEA